MRPKKFTFQQLCGELQNRAGQDDMPSTASVPNLVSALRGFMTERGQAWSDVIGSTLRRGFRAERDAHLEKLVSAGRPARYVRNRRNYLGVWRKLLRKIDDESAALDGCTTDLQDALQELAADGQAASLAKIAGISVVTLRNWMACAVPTPKQLSALRRLEIGLKLNEGELTDLLPPRARANLSQLEESQTIEYRKRLCVLRADRFRLKPTEVAVGSPLRGEWLEVLLHKTGRDTGEISAGKRNLYREAKAEADSSNGKRWRLKPLGPCDTLRKNGLDADCWVDVIGNQKCASARASFNHISDFFGWARLAPARGGLGLPIESLTLGLFTDVNAIDGFIDWRIERSGSINNGIINWLGFVKSLCRSDCGYLPRHPAIGIRVGVRDAVAWKKRCAEAHAFLLKTQSALKPKARHSRDPQEALKASLEKECPVDDFVEGLRRLRRAKPGAGGRNEAIWGRDVLLLALAMSNPLRETNLRELTCRPDNTGHLRKTADGWQIRIEPSEFKNERFFRNQADGVYEQAVHPSVAPLIERYIKTYRPLLLGSNTSDVLFVSSRGRPYSDGDLSVRFTEITRRRVPNCPGVGLHAMRHIMASTIILRTRGDYVLAAKYLHDKPETVAKFYAHILGRVADRGRTEVLGDIFDR